MNIIIKTSHIKAWLKDGKVMLAKCIKTGKFVSVSVVQSFVQNIIAVYTIAPSLLPELLQDTQLVCYKDNGLKIVPCASVEALTWKS